MSEQAISNEALIGYIESMKDYFLTEESVRNYILHVRKDARLLERDTEYKKDELVYSEDLPLYYKLLCVSTGTTASE